MNHPDFLFLLKDLYPFQILLHRYSLCVNHQTKSTIFDYAHNNITYAGVRLADDWDAEWYAGLQNIEQNGTTGGDCYTYYAVANVLLQRAGAETMRVERQNAGQPPLLDFV